MPTKNPVTQISKIAYRTLLSLPANFYWMDKKGILLGCNKKTLKDLKIKSLANFIGKHSTDIVAKEAWENSKLVMDKNQAMQFEETHTNLDGSKIVYLSIKLPITANNNSKKVIGLAGISIDITDRKKHESSLQTAKTTNEVLTNFIAKLKYKITGQKSEVLNAEQNAKDLVDYLEEIIATLPGNIYWKDRNGHFLGCNNQVAKILKLKSRKNIIGKTNYELFDKHLADLATQADKQTMDSGKELIIEETGLDTNDNRVTYLSRKKPLFDKKSNVIGLLGVSFDITERKQAEAKIMQLEKEKTIIETKRQTISDLAASIAHEIGNLLGGIMINMQLLDSALRPKIKVAMEKHDNQYQRTLELLDDLKKGMENAKFMFESIKLNIRSGEINKEHFEFTNIADDINTVLTSCFPEEEAIANIKWNQKENFEYIGIPAYTRNMLVNLLKNALHFIKEQYKGEIKLTLKKGEKFNQLIVEDTAKGIPEESLPKIFTTFSTTRKGGIGMGLSFCKKVMNEYGGDIICESKLNKYTRFILSFPVVRTE